MKKSKTLRLGEVFKEILQEEPEFQTQMLAQHIADLLPKVLGTYYQFVTKITLADDLLYIYVKSPAARQAFNQNVGTMRERINESLQLEGFTLREVRILQ